MKRIGMNDITDILRHRHGLGLTRDQIAAAVGVSSGTVSHVLERAAAAGLTWPLPEDIDDDALRARLYPPCERDSGRVQPDWDAVIEELEKPRKRRRARLTRCQLGAKGAGAMMRAKAEQSYAIPGSDRTRVAAETMRGWFADYPRGGFDALYPKPRTDRGKPRRLRVYCPSLPWVSISIPSRSRSSQASSAR